MLPALWALTWPFLCVPVALAALCVLISSSYKDIGQIGLGLSPMASF